MERGLYVLRRGGSVDTAGRVARQEDRRSRRMAFAAEAEPELLRPRPGEREPLLARRRTKGCGPLHPRPGLDRRRCRGKPGDPVDRGSGSGGRHILDTQAFPAGSGHCPESRLHQRGGGTGVEGSGGCGGGDFGSRGGARHELEDLSGGKARRDFLHEGWGRIDEHRFADSADLVAPCGSVILDRGRASPGQRAESGLEKTGQSRWIEGVGRNEGVGIHDRRQCHARLLRTAADPQPDHVPRSSFEDKLHAGDRRRGNSDRRPAGGDGPEQGFAAEQAADAVGRGAGRGREHTGCGSVVAAAGGSVDRQLADGREELDGLPAKTPREGHIPAVGHGRNRDIPHADRAHRLKRRLNLPGCGAPADLAGGPAGKAERKRAATDCHRQRHPLHGADARDACRGIAYRHAGDCQNARHEGVDRPASEAADEGHIPAVGRANDRLDADIPGADRAKGLECRLDGGGRGTGGDRGACLATVGDGEGSGNRPRHPLHGAASDRAHRRVGHRRASVDERRRGRGRGPKQGDRPPSEATDEGHIPAIGRAGDRLDAHIGQPNG